MKRAKYFITCSGKYYGEVSFNDEAIKNRLLLGNIDNKKIVSENQISFFDSLNYEPDSSKSNVLLPSSDGKNTDIIIPNSNILTLPEKLTSISGEF